MTDISTTTQAILDTLSSVSTEEPRIIAAAILECLIDQVVPDRPRPSSKSAYNLMNWSKTCDQYYQRQQTRDEILIIASELRNISTTGEIGDVK